MSQTTLIDPIALAQDLIRRPSVTPADAGAMGALREVLEALGFACRPMPFGDIENLYARLGAAGPNLCFAGHTDVVPPGDAESWSTPPFSGAIQDGVLTGRGAVDMKSAIAAFVAAVARVVAKGRPTGSISLLITGDEEGLAEHGTRAVVPALAAAGERIDHCVVGEPTSSALLGDMIKIGRRGSLGGIITVDGVQGHVAYPDRAANPIPVLVRLLARLQARALDTGFEAFQPSNLEITSVDVGNGASNVIPGRATARLNIRFNPNHTGAALAAWLMEEAGRAGEGFKGKVMVETRINGEAFLTPRGPFTEVVAAAVRAVTGREPELSTTGGTSDARFIRDLCPVVEFGLVGTTMHKANERAPVAEIHALSAIYERLIEGYFAAFA
ncbi:MAG: succinyl-diaminopimelate desuccinylase [Caulobacteraceae bacterium]|nr:succinyl-diaminopimelate desuccinylase [Caulobacteraceae bacterium]